RNAAVEHLMEKAGVAITVGRLGLVVVGDRFVCEEQAHQRAHDGDLYGEARLGDHVGEPHPEFFGPSGQHAVGAVVEGVEHGQPRKPGAGGTRPMLTATGSTITQATSSLTSGTTL